MGCIWFCLEIYKNRTSVIGNKFVSDPDTCRCANTGKSDPTQMDTERAKEPDRRDERGGFEREERT